MSKGAYDVNDPNVGPTKDGSFRSCICAMLVFISICGIILIVTTVLKTSNDKTKNYPDPDNKAGYADSILGNESSKRKNPESEKTTTEVINVEVETVFPHGEDSLTTRRSGKINIATTTTSPKLVLTVAPKSDKTENSLEVRPETTTVSQTQTANLSTNKPELNNDKRATNSPQTTKSTSLETTTENIDATTQKINDHPTVPIGNKDKPATNSPQTTKSTSLETTTENIDATTQKINDHPTVPIGNKDKPATNSPQTTKSTSLETTTENIDATTQKINDHPNVPIGNKDKPATNSPQTTKSISLETTTENIDATTQNIDDTSKVPIANKDKPSTNNPQTTKSSSLETTTESVDTNTQEIDDKSNVPIANKDKPSTNNPQTTKSSSLETTTENVDTTTQEIDDKSNVPIANKNKPSTNNPQTTKSSSLETTTESVETTTQEIDDKSNVPIANKNKPSTNNPQTTKSSSLETTTENVETTTQEIDDKSNVPIANKNKPSTNNPQTTKSSSLETTTESVDTNTQEIDDKSNVPIANKNKPVANSPQTTKSSSLETTTESVDTSTQDIDDKSNVPIGNKDKPVANSPQTTKSTSLETTTESVDTSTQEIDDKSNVPIGNKNKPVANSPQTTKSSSLETTTESVDTTTQDIDDKSNVPIGNKDKPVANSPQTTESTSLETTTESVDTSTQEIDDKPSIPTRNKNKLDEKATQDPSSTTQAPAQETTTRPSQYKLLTPSQNERTSTIEETEGTVDHTRTTESLEIRSPESDPCGAECRKAGARILSRMNHSGDACEHFYDYACGGDNIDNTPEDNWKRIADGLDRINSQSPDVYKTFQRFYKSCVNFHIDYDFEGRVNEATQMITSVGQASINDIGEKWALTDLLTRLLLLDSSPLFDISVDVAKPNQHFVFQLNLGKRFSTFPDQYTSQTTKRKCLEYSKNILDISISHFNSVNLNDMYNSYLECQKTETYKHEVVEKALEVLGMKEDYEDALNDHIPKILDQFEKLPSPAVVRKNIITRKFETRKVAEMKHHYPSIEWKQLLKNLTGTEVDDEDEVQVYFKEFFVDLLGPKSTLSTVELHEAILAMYAHDLYTNFILPTPTNNPEELCLKHSSDLMREVASAMFLDSIDPKNTNNPEEIEISGDLKRVEDLFSKMKSKLTGMIQKASWIDFSTQNSMIRKLNNTEFDSWNRSTIWKNMTLVQDRMKNIKKEYGNYSEFVAALVKRNRQLLYNMWDTSAYNEINVWWHFITPYSTDPKSTYSMNRVFIPPGALLTKSEKVPGYLSLVKLGFKLAKAIARHFDYFGFSDLTGKPKHSYNETKNCILQSYTKVNGAEHNGKYLQFQVTNDPFMLSLNDRYAEDLAINLLASMSSDDLRDYEFSWVLENPDYPNLSKAFDREKLFFIALGQEHCKKPRWEDFFVDFFESEHFSTPLLLDNSLAHLELFSQVFECKDGSRMNIPVRCKPFPLNDEPEDYEDYLN